MFKALHLLKCIDVGYEARQELQEAIEELEEFVKSKNELKFTIYQGDRFTQPFKIASFLRKEDAEAYLEMLEKASEKVDEFTCFFKKEE
ncbi:hypothetical protein CRU92_06405 [Arcobacter sp. FW59]|nr:hypothetical protein CRU92_06405 [Arcobacter sp. FW59]